ncbi:DUF5518 domain-containing protein [Natrialbaceae archaeon A-chndr2]
MNKSTAIHALIGALVGAIISFIPFSTVIGGALAGFLEGPDNTEGFLAGLLAGIFLFIPALGSLLFVFGFLGFGFGLGGLPFEGLALSFVILSFIGFVVGLYTIGAAAVGGFIGAWAAREYPEQRYRLRDTLGFSTDSSVTTAAGDADPGFEVADSKKEMNANSAEPPGSESEPADSFDER